MKLAVIGVLLTMAGMAWAGDVQVIDDFEAGPAGWYLVEGTKPPGAGPLCTMSPSSAAKVGRGCARLQFAPCPNTWTHMQLNVSTLEWIGSDCDRIAFWVKGDGSGENLIVMLGNYVIKPSLSFSYRIPLDFTDWRRVVVPFNDFTPAGRLPAELGKILLVQLGVSNTRKPVDVLIDDILALPAERGGKPGRFFDLDVQPTGAWETSAPAAPVPVDNMHGLPADIVLSRYIHGVRNHKDLHNPVRFAVDYPETGTFAVKVTETSGYGGSQLIIGIDGKEALHRDFPGETETSLTKYQGYYAVEVPAGKHVISVDNQGNDWIIVAAYRFGNYATAGVKVRRDTAAVAVTVLDRNGEPLPGASVTGDVAGQPLAFTREGRSFVSESLSGRYPYGRYPVAVTARRGGGLLFTAHEQVRVSSPRLTPLRTAFAVGAPVEFAVRYSDDADVPTAGLKLSLHYAGRALPMQDAGDGIYEVNLGALAAGVYAAAVSGAGTGTYPAKFVVYDPHAKPWTPDGADCSVRFIRLSDRGRFVTSDGRQFLPWGFATIGVFNPNPEVVSRPDGDSRWCRASDAAVLAWIGLLRSYGINCVRFGVNVDGKAVNGDLGGHANPFIVERLHHFLDLIGPLGVKALPVLWWGHYRNFGFQDIPAYDALIHKQADWFTNPQALELQKQYVREMVGPFQNDPRIFAWEVMNETYSAGGDLPAAVRWANAIIDTIHSVDRNHLITISACVATPTPETEWMRTADIDFFNYHAYPTYLDYSNYSSKAGDAIREMGNYAAMMALADRLGGKVNILGETGNDRGREVNYPEFRALITRDCLWLAVLCGSPGGISWDAIADPREFEVLSQLAGRIDWNRFTAAPAPVAVRVADLDKDLGNLARYSWWSLQTGVPIEFIGGSDKPRSGQIAADAASFAPPQAPTPCLTVTPGFQSKYLMSKDGRTFLGYVRNVGEILPQNVRTRTPRPLTIRVTGLPAGKLEIWDLDTRSLLRTVKLERSTRIDLGVTRHDYALLRTD